MDNRNLGILGGGQLGRMMVEAAHRLNVNTVILDSEGAPAKQINALSDHVNGSFSDEKAVQQLAAKSDVLTVEIEHVNVQVLQDIEKTGKPVYPSPQTIKIIQDKYLQKEYLIQHNIATAQAKAIDNPTAESLYQVGNELGYPFMLKSRTQAYDGRGNFAVMSKNDVGAALEALHNRPLYAEKWAKFSKELAVMVVRSIDGSVYSYPTVETVHKDNICHLVFAPARVSDSTKYRAKLEAEKAIKHFSGAGIFGVEMFLLEGTNEILINEIAPRPHNSGHYTQDACVTSQFEAHIRSVMGLPLPQGFSKMTTPNTYAIMLNILGDETPNRELEACKRALSVPGAIVHLYGKSTRKGRKMGHINIVSSSMDDCEAKLDYIMGKTTETGNESQQQLQQQQIAGTSTHPLVSVIMGSDSDLPVMAVGANILKKFNVPFELKIVSAHRTPHRMAQFAEEAAARGVKVIIAGAGGAAHLPGMVAAMTSLPVIGVPVKGSVLDGVDSLHSIVQMPRGIPVATVAINNSTNAALLAIRILGAFMPQYRAQMEKYMNDMEDEVLGKTARVEKEGYENY